MRQGILFESVKCKAFHHKHQSHRLNHMIRATPNLKRCTSKRCNIAVTSAIHNNLSLNHDWTGLCFKDYTPTVPFLYNPAGKCMKKQLNPGGLQHLNGYQLEEFGVERPHKARLNRGWHTAADFSQTVN
jgi:hypothetical protein